MVLLWSGVQRLLIRPSCTQSEWLIVSAFLTLLVNQRSNFIIIYFSCHRRNFLWWSQPSYILNSSHRKTLLNIPDRFSWSRPCCSSSKNSCSGRFWHRSKLRLPKIFFNSLRYGCSTPHQPRSTLFHLNRSEEGATSAYHCDGKNPFTTISGRHT